MAQRILILGAGFGGLELATTLSEALGDDDRRHADRQERRVRLRLLEARRDVRTNDARRRPAAVPRRRQARRAPAARDRHRDRPRGARRVETDGGTYEADVLVVALGADYDVDATPGLAEGGNEFYSVAGATALRDVLPSFAGGRVVIGVCGAPFKCPPAPSECAFLLHDLFVERGIRADCDLKLVMPFGTPVPPSPDASAAILEGFAERDIEFVAGRRVNAIDPTRKVAVLDDESELPFDLFLGVPRHRAPEVVIASGMTENGYIPVDSATLATRYPGVYAVGDVATAGVPKAGVFAEGAARVVARQLIAEVQGGAAPAAYDGRGSCYIEFGAGRIGRVDIDFLTGPKPTGVLQKPSSALVAEKTEFGASRRARWFG